MTRRLTIHVPDDLYMRLDRVSRARDETLDTVINEIIEQAVGSQDRLARLQRYVTWTDQDLQEFEEELAEQRGDQARLEEAVRLDAESNAAFAMSVQPVVARIVGVGPEESTGPTG
jgi:predicted transcriptional regulator